VIEGLVDAHDAGVGDEAESRLEPDHAAPRRRNANRASLIAADRLLRWGIESIAESKGGVPFWMTPGLQLTTILYAAGLAIAGAAMVSLLPALRMVMV